MVHNRALMKGSGPARRTFLHGVAAGAVGTFAPRSSRSVRRDDTIELPAGGRQTLRIERSPFRLALVAADGAETVGTLPGREGQPIRMPGADGPQPVEPLGTLGAFPALGFVVGTNVDVTFPASFFTGNRLFGAEAGAVVSLVEVVAARRHGDRLTLEVRTDAPSLPPATARVRRLPLGGVRLDVLPPPGLCPVATMVTLASPGDEGLYGLGARKDTFDQRGKLRNVWVEQQNATSEDAETLTSADVTGATGSDYTFPNGAQAAYYVTAALHGSRGWTAWVTQTELSRLDLGRSRGDAVRWGVAAPRLVLSLAGGGLEESSRAYTADVGRAPSPPRYVYEPWIDVINEGEGEAAPNGQGFTGGKRVRRDVEEIVRHAREDDLPIGVIGVEGWQSVPGKETFFPALRREGFRLSAYWNPFHSSGNAAYEEALARDLFVKDPAGEPYPIVTNRGGLSHVIDFSHPDAAAFWTRQITRSCELGFEAFMHDFGEFVTEGMRFHNGKAPDVEHNAYPVRYHRAARVAVESYAARHPDFEPFFYVRSGSTGATAATSSVFPGDETTDWSQGSGLPSVVPAMLNLAMGGGFTFTTDVGGYLDLLAPRTGAELFTRWVQLAAFTPVSRIHNSTFGGSAYPWSFGEETLAIYRRYAKAKRRLIPLVDHWSRRASRDGTIGPVRPLVLDDPSPAARSVDDQWLLGRDILVAPVLAAGATTRTVYLPAGARWRRVVVEMDGRLVPADDPADGGRTVTAPAPITDIPVFLRVTSTPRRR